MAFQRAILPAVLSWADKLVMIGKYWNTYLIALRRSDLGNPRLRYNNMAMIDCRI